MTRSSLDVVVPYARDRQIDICFFCNTEVLPVDPKHPDRNARYHKRDALTDRISNNVKAMAQLLNDTAILGKLGGVAGMQPLDAVYHHSCLCELQNRYRTRLRSLKREEEKLPTAESEALAEVVMHIEDQRINSETLPVFELANLFRLYCSNIKQKEPDATQVPQNRTRFKERLLHALPDLIAESDSSNKVHFVFKQDIGESIRQAKTRADLDNEAVLLARVATLARSDGLFSEGDTPTLRALIQMIMVGGQTDYNRSLQIKTVVETIKFNSLQKPLSQTATAQQKAMIPSYSRHIRKRETKLSMYIGMKLLLATGKSSLVNAMYFRGLGVSYGRLQIVTSDIANSAIQYWSHVIMPGKS